MKTTPSSTSQAPKTSAEKAKPAKFRKQDKGVGKGQQAGRKRQEVPEAEETEDQVLVSKTGLRTIRTLLVRHDQALNRLAVDRTYVLFFSTTDMSTLTMLRTVTDHWREQYEQGRCKVRAGCGSYQGDDGQGPLSRSPAPLGLHSMEPTREEGSGHRSTAPVIGRVEGRDQDAAGSSYDRGRHPQIRAHAEARHEHLGSGRGLHPSVDNEIQSGERVHAEMTKLVNSAALSLVGLRLRPEKLQLSPLAKVLAGLHD